MLIHEIQILHIVFSATLIEVFLLIIGGGLSQDLALNFFLIKSLQKSRLAYAAIYACKFRNKTKLATLKQSFALAEFSTLRFTPQMPRPSFDFLSVL